jgi:hypothetical protein
MALSGIGLHCIINSLFRILTKPPCLSVSAPRNNRIKYETQQQQCYVAQHGDKLPAAAQDKSCVVIRIMTVCSQDNLFILEQLKNVGFGRLVFPRQRFS